MPLPLRTNKFKTQAGDSDHSLKHKKQNRKQSAGNADLALFALLSRFERAPGTTKFLRFGVNLHYNRLQLSLDTAEAVTDVLLQLLGSDQQIPQGDMRQHGHK